MNHKPFITLPTRRGVELIDVNAVVYICFDEGNCIFHFNSNKHKIVNCSISSLENILEKDNMPFVRCHQQCIVNIFKIKEIFTGSNGLALTNGKEFKITRTYKERFREMMNKYCCRIVSSL